MLIVIIITAITLTIIGKKSKFYLHMLQLEGYKSDQYEKWIKANHEKAFSWKIINEKAKKPLVFTNRAQRIYGANIFLNAIIILVIGSIVWKMSIGLMALAKIIIFSIYLIGLIFLYYFQSYSLLYSNNFMLPIETSINMKFYKQAQNKIKSMKDLKVVGITGSFGKTSTKFIVATILAEKFKVLNTPESYNTPMGLSKTINNDLSPDDNVFIAELGARNIGDIEEVAALVHPNIGVITSIGPTHLETFINMDNIMKTKYELIEELPTDGLAILNYENEYIKKLADKTFKEKFLYGLEDKEDLDLYAEDIEVSERGSSFTLKLKDGQAIQARTKLLGKHNIYNILAGVAVALRLGLSLDQIRDGIEKIEPIPHRLNIINPGTGLIIIDDAFNSNPIGSKAALEVLSQFKEGKKIIVTPGMVELGAMEVEANTEFGVNIGKVCDYVILIGEKRTQPIYQGLMSINYNKENIFVVNNLEEATIYIQKIAKAKDVILFENDLPDNYNE